MNLLLEFLTNLYDVISPKKGDLKTLDIPINAELNAIIDFGNILKNKDKFAENIGSNIKEINFHLEGGQGKIGFLNNDDFDYHFKNFNTCVIFVHYRHNFNNVTERYNLDNIHKFFR